MSEPGLKNTAIVTELDFREIFELLKLGLKTEKEGLNIVFEGFTYLGPSTINNLRSVDKYNLADKLSKLEIQKEQKDNYHKGLIAREGDTIIGALICQWINSNLYGQKFWKYHISFVDVHKDYRNLGISGQLFTALNNSEFLDGKILQAGSYSDDGKEFLPRVVSRCLTAENYAFLPSRYTGKVPRKFGVYTSPVSF